MTKQSFGGILIDGRKLFLREVTNHFRGYVWTYPKGKAKEGETAKEAALREVLEESGYVCDILDKEPRVINTGAKTMTLFFMQPLWFEGYGWETQAAGWYTYEEAEKLIKQTTNVRGRTRDLRILRSLKEELD